MFKKRKLEEVEAALDKQKYYPHWDYGIRPWRFRPWIDYCYFDGNYYVLNLGFFYICYMN